jgi:phosphoenolpyruvate carboxykinase (ATP)
MQESGHKHSSHDLASSGITSARAVYWNLTVPELYEEIARRTEGVISREGALIVDTGEHTGRSAKDKAITREASSESDIWWGEVNKDFSQEKFNLLRERMFAYCAEKDLFVQDVFAGADPRYRLSARIITELAWHSLFARTLFIDEIEATTAKPEFTVVNIPSFRADPERDGTRSQTFILLDFSQKLVLIGGTSYAGETKKSIFTVLNYLLPKQGVMSMHCSANVAQDDPENVAVFFGLSGTGKTTLSADPERLLIGDDEHGWTDEGVFNFEGGCYAKVIRLSTGSRTRHLPHDTHVRHGFGERRL